MEKEQEGREEGERQTEYERWRMSKKGEDRQNGGGG